MSGSRATIRATEVDAAAGQTAAASYGVATSPRGFAAAVTGAYLLAGGLWILLSDRLLGTLLPGDDAVFLTRLQTFKGWFFVAFTGLLLYALVHWGGRRLQAGRRALVQSESLFRGVVESNAVAICVWHSDGRITQANDAFLALTGYTRADLRAGLLDWVRMTPGEFASRDRSACDQATARGGGSDPYEKQYVRKDGRRVPVLLTVAPLDGDPHVGVSAVLDITDRKRAEEQAAALTAALESAGRLKDQFLAVLSHELRTPLTAIRLWTDLLRADAGHDRALFDEATENIEQGVEAQTQLINDLLDVSRIASGQLRVERTPTDLRALVRGAADAVAPAARERGVTLDARIPSGAGGNGAAGRDDDAAPIMVMGDAGRLRQVAWNLLMNAIKFTPKGGRVTVDLRRDEGIAGTTGRAVLSVTDTGEGLRPDFIPHLFEPFRQADSSTTRRHGGLGIGLSIARRLAEMHGGTIAAHSDGPGAGSAFVVELPLMRTPARPPAAGRGPDEPAAAADPSPARPGDDPADAVPPPPLVGVRVLVVDDHAETCRAVSRLLRSQGADVHVASTAAAALELARAVPPSVLVSDIGMPDLDGHDLIRALRGREDPRGDADANAANGHVRVYAIALTAYAMPEDREKALAAGFDDYLSKPVDFGELLEKVKAGAGTSAVPVG